MEGRNDFTHALAAEIKRSQDSEEPVTAVLAQMALPPRSGGTAAVKEDEVGARALEVIRGVLREDDTSLRWGPRTYAIVLPAADRFAAAVVCQRIDGVVRAALREIAGIEVSFTFGLADQRRSGSAGDMVSAAERELADAGATALAG